MRRALATLTALASLAALSLTTPPPASAQPAKAGVVTALLGTATVVRASTKESLPLKFRDAVFLQDRVKCWMHGDQKHLCISGTLDVSRFHLDEDGSPRD